MSTTTNTSPDDLRAAMVARILAEQDLAPDVEAALREVERHRFVPNATVRDAYDEIAVITHTFPDGTHLSCASGPKIVAGMLDALQVEPGHKILEIGAGTGYNAALLATLAGPSGSVVTIDINESVTADARRHLDDTGFDNVTVLAGDGAQGDAAHGPYDRIIVTVGAWDLPRAWWDQLRPSGRLVVPLRWRGTTRAVALVKGGDRWECDWVFLCGFVPMLGQDGELSAPIDPDGHVNVYYDIDQTVDAEALRPALTTDKITEWTDVTVHGQEPFDRVWLRLTASDASTVRIQADEHAISSGLCTPAIGSRTPALVEGGSLAYFAVQRLDTTPPRWKTGAIGHGPDAARLVARLIRQIEAWGNARIADPEIIVYPSARSAPDQTHAMVIRKIGSTLVIRY